MITSPEYFDVFKIQLLRGRAFTNQDATGASPVAIVNQAMAKQVLAERRSLGRPDRHREGRRAGVR